MKYPINTAGDVAPAILANYWKKGLADIIGDRDYQHIGVIEIYEVYSSGTDAE